MRLSSRSTKHKRKINGLKRGPTSIPEGFLEKKTKVRKGRVRRNNPSATNLPARSSAYHTHLPGSPAARPSAKQEVAGSRTREASREVPRAVVGNVVPRKGRKLEVESATQRVPRAATGFSTLTGQDLEPVMVQKRMSTAVLKQ